MKSAPTGLGRRVFLELCGVVGTGLIGPSLGCGSRGGMNDSTPQVVPPGTGTLAIPPRLEGELIDGVRVFRLSLQRGSMEWVPGNPTATYGANGAYLGPTLHLRRGERVRLEVKNTLATTTTLHWHGMQLPARADGGPYQTIAPGTTWLSEFEVVQRALTAWYHPHLMMETARHAYMGIAGMIQIEDTNAVSPDLPSNYGVDDLPLVIQDRRFAANGTHPYSDGQSPSMHDTMAGLRGETMLVNGTVKPHAIVPKGLVRLRALNGSNARNYHLGFSDNRRFWLIATDGGLLAAPFETTRVLLAPGERAEVLVDFGGDAKSSTVTLQSFSGEVHGALFKNMMAANAADALDRSTFDVMSFEAGAEPARPIARPTAFAPIERMAPEAASRTRQLILTMSMGMGGGMGGGMGAVAINGATMMALDDVPAAIDFRIPSGSTEIWAITNQSEMAHPIHIHHRHFQIIDIDGVPPPPPLAGWKDTVLVRPGQVVRLVLRFDGSANTAFPYMFHCHILEHEDRGMMGRFFIV